MDALTILNTSVSLMSLVLGGFAIWLSFQFYSKSKESEKEAARTLEAIRAQSEALQRLTGRWMDRFTRHATQPRPADEGLITLVDAVANLPTMILTHLRVPPEQGASGDREALLSELIDCYICLYHYTALANIGWQGMLPASGELTPGDETQSTVSELVDSTAADFAYMGRVLGKVDEDRLRASSYRHLLDIALDTLRPSVRSAEDGLTAKREQQDAGSDAATRA